MRLDPFVVGPLGTNCYLLSQAGSAVVIDPGDEGDFLSEQLIRRSLTLEAILFTHGHFDHLLGALPLKLNFPDARIYLHSADAFLYARALSSAHHYVPHYAPDPLPPVDVLFTDTALPDLSFGLRPLLTPGHTPGSVCYYLPSEALAKEGLPGLLFSGDTLFKGTVGETRHRYSSALALSASLQSLKSLPGETLVYPGHGEPTTLARELP